MIALTVHAAASSGDGVTATTPARNTTGASLIIIGVINYTGAGGAVAPTDSLGNTWTGLTVQSDATTVVKLWYCASPTTGAAHTFQASAGGSFPAIAFAAYTGTDAMSPFDVENGYPNFPIVTNQPGAVTPNQTDSLLAALVGNNAVVTSMIDSGFNIEEQLTLSGGLSFGLAYADLVETAIATQNPTWTNIAGPMVIAVFKPGAAGPAVIELTGIASSFAAGTPTMVSAGTVVPDGIPSSFAAGTPTLHATVTIGLTGIPSSFAAGIPTLIEGGGGGGGHASAWYWSGPAARMLADAGFLLLVLPELERQELEEAAAK